MHQCFHTADYQCGTAVLLLITLIELVYHINVVSRQTFITKTQFLRYDPVRMDRWVYAWPCGSMFPKYNLMNTIRDINTSPD